MAIYLHSIANHAAFLLKEGVSFSLDYSQKKVALIALAIFSGLAFCCFFGVRHYFNAKKTTSSTPSSPSLQQPIPTPKQEAQINYIPQPKNQDEVKAKEKLISAETIRIICRGHESFLEQNGHVSEKTLQRFDTIIEAFNTYKKDFGNQQSTFNNQNPELVYIREDDFGRSNEMMGPQFEIFLRYLIVKGEIVAYEKARVGYALYLHENAKDNTESQKSGTYFDDKKLKEMDSQLEKLPIPSVKSFPQDEQSTVEPIIKKIIENYYDQFKFKSHHVYNFSQNLSNPLLFSVMDKLVRHGFIYAWNRIPQSGQVAVKLTKEDVEAKTASYSWKEWRDSDLIQQQEQFKKDNQLVIPEKNLKAANFTSEESKELTKLITELNQRVKSGPFIWKSTSLAETIKVLNFLKDKQFIAGFDRPSSYEFKIFVKESDRI